MEPHEGIEDEKARAELGHRLVEALPVGVEVEAQGGRGDDLHVEGREVHAGGDADPLEPLPDDVEGVLGGVEAHPAGPGHRETTKAGNACRNGNGEVEGQERLAAFGLASDDADRLLGPEAGDEPAPLFRPGREPVGGLVREEAHRRRPALAGAGAAKASRKSFSSRWRRSRWAATARSSPAMFMRDR